METLDELFNQNKYIAYKEYKDFCQRNNIIVNDDVLSERNDQFINKKLIEYKEYFDHMFTDIGEKINLDEEQRKIVLRNDDYCLINAGAGSGKSTTMAAKVKYLVDKLKVKPEEIIMLTFTKKSSEDLDEKVNEALDLGIPVSTFHSLGMKFVKKFYPYPIQVVGTEEQKNIICNYIKELYKDKKRLKELIELFKQYENKSYIAKGFIENYQKFDTFEEYFEDYKKRKYITQNNKTGGIHQYLINRLSLRNSLYTIRGEKVKSIGEVRIANFLYINGIDYTYEKIFEEKVNEDSSYQPDFTIEDQGKNIYIEYFGLSNCYNAKNELNRKEIAKYNRTRKIKEKFQGNNNNDFINLDYKTPDGDFITALEKELLNRNIEFKRKSDKEIFDRILDNNLNAEFFKFTSLVISFIDIFKNMLVDNEDYMFEKRISEIRKEKFKYYYYSGEEHEEANNRVKALEYLKDIYKYYQKYLLENHMIDYSDMINLSYKQIIQEVKNKYPELNYKYIIVDEYQDITFQRFLFVKRLIEYFNAKLISVGDDWQSIYAFAGSRLELFNKFSEMFLNSKDDMYLSTTYRYGQELADITSKFILENNEQSKKNIKSIKKLEHPIEICEYKAYEEYEEINKLVHKLYKEDPNNNILILARTNECLNKLAKSEFFTKGINDVLICKDLPDAKIEALTMHRSKGLTSDQVIVFGLREKLFPSKAKPSHWIFEYFRLDSITEQMPFAEERRLFYVALTRTKNKVYLVVPNRKINKSEFVNEIEAII
ncbi:MAG: UvrD-helicase domain-containing protein [Clostridia bacterium]|nr:UvrD-helicase domain-containing protein [Clostridia bacterium]